ncbi:stb3p [Saccharomyces arboricola H-6]|uniref:Stb3p n=1 Tax=Saccharomyces arboricola (strain H-6 / AS 2.3317 / CBS 10644) TaxID=1160507 RepID=J8LJV2_SACAR|nr:stb3p [Saccharomyces arboricola H-6]
MSEDQKDISPPQSIPTKPEANSNMFSTKPISTSSPAGLAAAQRVTPGKLSALLLEKGPLAIRHITQTLCLDIPCFKDLSSSKQRRLIMSAMESGDKERSVVFEKIGWGQWSAKKVDPANFDKELEATNFANSKVKDLISQESQRRKSNNSNSNSGCIVEMPVKIEHTNANIDDITTPPVAPASATTTIHVNIKPSMSPPAAANVVYIDENALASEDEDEEFDEDDHHSHYQIKSRNGSNNFGKAINNDPYSFGRRRSQVVFADSTPENIEHEIIAQKIRPLLRNRRRSSIKPHTPFITKLNAHQDSSYFSPNPTSTTTPSNNANANQGKVDLEKLTATSEPTSRRASRLSVSKESSIRSTLFPNKNYLIVTTNPNSKAVSVSTSPKLEEQINMSQNHLILSDKEKNKIASQHLDGESSPQLRSHSHRQPHSDTDEEDWESIGAASLRNNSLVPNIDIVASSTNGVVSPKPTNPNFVNSQNEEIGSPLQHDQQKHDQQPKNGEENNAAFLLMSLKS